MYVRRSVLPTPLAQGGETRRSTNQPRRIFRQVSVRFLRMLGAMGVAGTDFGEGQRPALTVPVGARNETGMVG
jgi:hypothetical protein